MSRPNRVVLAFAIAAVLAGCGEKAQVMSAATRKPQAEPWVASDAANPAFRAPGWTADDPTSWEQQIRRRNQAQNDYAAR